jgi:hypothetical protein
MRCDLWERVSDTDCACGFVRPQGSEKTSVIVSRGWKESSVSGGADEATARFLLPPSAPALGVRMIDMASTCTTRTYTSNLWHNRCVNHRSSLMCTQGTL